MHKALYSIEQSTKCTSRTLLNYICFSLFPFELVLAYVYVHIDEKYCILKSILDTNIELLCVVTLASAVLMVC